MRWEKLGLVYAPDGGLWWARSHAYMPTPLVMNDGSIRIFLAFLDHDLVGRMGYVDVSGEDPKRILGVSRSPLLDVGEPGTFDEWGVTPMSIVRSGESLLMYYTGWQRTRSNRYTMLTGLALSRDDGRTFSRAQHVPVLDRSEQEQFFRTAMFVLHHSAGWSAWYAAGSRWIESDGKTLPTYDLRFLASRDGVHWPDSGEVCLEPSRPSELGFGRPFVYRKDSGYEMLYSIRRLGLGYRPGLARSSDGMKWVRCDEEAGIDISPAGWDSEMLCFGSIATTPAGRWLFYNGNGYGATGVGVAVLADED